MLKRPVTTQQKPAEIEIAGPQMALPCISLSERESYSLRNGMLNLEADIESVLYQVDDALMLPLKTEAQISGLKERLICLKRLLEKSLHSVRDWKAFLSIVFLMAVTCTPVGDSIFCKDDITEREVVCTKVGGSTFCD